jgi:hypothetical protein
MRDINIFITGGFIFGAVVMGSVASVCFGWTPSIEWATFMGPFLGAIIGIVGIVFGALWNAEENRRRDDRLAYAEMRTLANAFYGEVALLQDGLSHQIKELSASPDSLVESSWQSASSPRILFEANAGKIGIFGPDIARHLAEYYASHWSLDEVTKEPHLNPLAYVNALRLAKVTHETGKKLVVELYMKTSPD